MGDSNPDLAKALTAKIDAKKPHLGKLFALRNKVYAHRSKFKSPEETFAEIGLTSDEMNAVILFVRNLIISLAEAVGERQSAELEEELELRITYSREDTQRIMQAIENS